MDKLFELKGRASEIYTKYSRYIDRVLRFILALFTFVYINKNIGFSTLLANPLVTVVVSIICTFLPTVITMLLAIGMILVHIYSVSLGLAIVSAALFLVIYAAYLRYTPGKSVVILAMMIASMVKMPVLVPIVLGLIGGPSHILAVSFGTIITYMVDYVKSYTTLIGTVAETGVMEQITAYAQQLFSNKVMWITVISYGLVLLIVYYLRKLEVDHAWKVAIVAGALSNIIVIALGNVMLDSAVAYGSLILSSVLAVIVSLVVEFFMFSVDYSRTEYLQFDDDEYYYYVKAVPKMKVAVSEKTVKRINERKEKEPKEKKKILPKKQVTAEEPKVQEADSDIQKIIDDELK